MRYKFAFLFTIFITFYSIAQNMQEGFDHLEKGQFSDAETYFEKILKTYPNNKTAKLCYGRAIGLNSNPVKATAIFLELLNTYPDDFEIKLNYAESLLWNKNFTDAKPYYYNLTINNPTSFAALLGYANTLSNLKQYSEALEYVNRALAVSEKNLNALISKKYIRLGYANDFVQKQDYTKALSILDEIFEDFPKDKETLLNKANVYLIIKDVKNAKKTYQELAINKSDSLMSLIKLSLVEHIGNRDKEALKIATDALEKSSLVSDKSIQNQAKERYVQALIWNKKYKWAELKIKEYTSTNTNENWVFALNATLGMYRSDYKQSINSYEQILVNDSSSFDGNLGISNAYFAAGYPEKAYQSVYKTLEIFPNQKDAVGFLQKVNDSFTPFVEQKNSYSFDNGNNNAHTSLTNIWIPTSTKCTFNGLYQYRKATNDNTQNSAVVNDFRVGAQYQFHPNINVNANIGVSVANSFSSSYSQVLSDVFFKIKPFKLQDLEIGYKRDIQNFNADLIDKQISADNFYVNYNLGTNYNFGWFTQYFFTTQSDSNERSLLFTSVYYSFLSNPVLKAGFNYQYISFKEQVPTVYFSPKKFNAYEIFVDFLKDEKSIEKTGIYYTMSLASGYQYIENNSKQATYRIQAKFGYKFSNRLFINFYGLKSNIASASASGFTFTEMGLRVKWLILSKPIFKTTIN